jgi:uroporphyrinogen decarboxylase
MNYSNDIILRAAKGEETERVPVWLMRQAGRILPEYRATRAQAGSFKSLLKNPELAAEVTVQPVDILGVDAAILFSDILVIPEALGLQYEMDEGKGPVFPKAIESRNDLGMLSLADVESRLDYVFQTIREIHPRLNQRVPLIGFAGAPWTIFCYMIEGKGSKTFQKARAMMMREPELAKQLLDMITDATIIYLKRQIQEGCAMVQLFDSWAGVLGPSTFAEFSIPYLRKICDAIDEAPITLFGLGASFALEDLTTLNCNTIGVDWHIQPKVARTRIGKDKTIQGNLDPAVLYADADVIRKETARMLDGFGPNRYIANLGHGLYPDINPNHVKIFIETVKSHQFSHT